MTAPTKNFRKRSAILSYLQQTTAHPSAETIYADLKPGIPDLSLGTVYRNLKLFQQQGLVSCIATVNGVERFDGNTQPHVHFVCNGCENVTDVMDMPMPELKGMTAGRVDSCQLCYTGICEDCLKTPAENTL